MTYIGLLIAHYGSMYLDIACMVVVGIWTAMFFYAVISAYLTESDGNDNA